MTQNENKTPNQDHLADPHDKGIMQNSELSPTETRSAEAPPTEPLAQSRENSLWNEEAFAGADLYHTESEHDSNDDDELTDPDQDDDETQVVEAGGDGGGDGNDGVNEAQGDSSDEGQPKSKFKTYLLMGTIVAVTGGVLLSGIGMMKNKTDNQAVMDQGLELRALERSPVDVEIVGLNDDQMEASRPIVLESSTDEGVGEPISLVELDGDLAQSMDQDQRLPDGAFVSQSAQDAEQTDTLVVYSNGSYGYRTEAERNQAAKSQLKHNEGIELFNEISTLNEKSDLLAKSVVNIEEGVQRLTNRTDEIADQNKAIASRADEHDKRLALLESFMEKTNEAVDKIKTAAISKPKPKTKPKTRQIPVTKPAPSVAAKPDVSPQPSIRIKETKVNAPQPKVKVAANVTQQSAALSQQINTDSITSYKVVGMYPSERMGVAPQKAWVTNGENLIELMVGSTLSGAKVTKIASGTVHTNKGVIR